MLLIITIYAIQNMMILKLGMSGIMNPTLRERIDKSIVGKLIKAKVNFGLGHPMKKKFKFTNQLAAL